MTGESLPSPGRATQQLDLGYPGTSLALQTRERNGARAGDWALIRPDGYVGAIVGAGEILALERYLAEGPSPLWSGAVTANGC